MQVWQPRLDLVTSKRAIVLRCHIQYAKDSEDNQRKRKLAVSGVSRVIHRFSLFAIVGNQLTSEYGKCAFLFSFYFVRVLRPS